MPRSGWRRAHFVQHTEAEGHQRGTSPCLLVDATVWLEENINGGNLSSLPPADRYRQKPLSTVIVYVHNAGIPNYWTGIKVPGKEAVETTYYMYAEPPRLASQPDGRVFQIRDESPSTLSVEFAYCAGPITEERRTP
jgi:hypothetical protein